jgi:hypothetical protein
MKKYLVSILLLLSLNSYSQVDSTKVWEAREVWRSDVENLIHGRPMPNWDLNGNIIPIVGIVLLLSISTKKLLNVGCANILDKMIKKGVFTK